MGTDDPVEGDLRADEIDKETNGSEDSAPLDCKRNEGFYD